MVAQVLQQVDDLALVVGVERGRRARLQLGTVLHLVDVGAALVAAALVLLVGAVLGNGVVAVHPAWLLLLAVPALSVATLTGVGAYQRRKCVIASVEISRVGRAVAFVVPALLLILQAFNSTSPYWTVLITSVLLFSTLVLGRAWFRHWLKDARAEGRFMTPVVIVGDGDAADRFAQRLWSNPESGYEPVAHVSADPDHEPGEVRTVLPTVATLDDDLHEAIDDSIHSAVLLTPNLSEERVSSAVRRLQHRFDHVQVVTSLAGVAHSRLVPTPLVDETTFYLEPVVASSWQRAVKRTTDVVLGSLLVVVTSPLLLAAAIAIKLTDRGPVLYAQERVGRNGVPIRIRKLRSMVVDAEARRDDVEEDNDRVGPLYKSASDPRITRVGRLLRATSIDELPQLWSIVAGDMSLVGPRPALPAEVAKFDDTHRRRHEVLPGLTGLWQVEDRDHPDFERYRRHDVFYVENWSLSLDLAILLRTAAVVVARGVRAVASPRGVGA